MSRAAPFAKRKAASAAIMTILLNFFIMRVINPAGVFCKLKIDFFKLRPDKVAQLLRPRLLGF